MEDLSASTQHLPRSVQTRDRLEGEISSLLDKIKAANLYSETIFSQEPSQKSKQPLIPPPIILAIPNNKLNKPDVPLIPSEVLPIELIEKQPSTANKKDLRLSPEKSSESKPPAEPTIFDEQWLEQSIENDGLLSSWKDIIDDRSDYENKNTSLSPSENPGRMNSEEGVIEVHRNYKQSIIPYESVDDEFNE